MNASLKIALASVGLGRVQRGFERWAQDLFDAIGEDPEVQLTLFRSRMPRSSCEMVPTMLCPATHVLRRLPLAALAGKEEYKRDAIAFALCMLPVLTRKRFDVIHVVDPPLAVVLGHIRRVIRFPGRLLFTDGCMIPPEFYPRVDHLHHVSLVAHEKALAAGVHPSRMTLVPSGMHADRFDAADDRAALRRRHGISNTTFVVLVVSALKREHKRVDYAINEVARLEGDVLLWIDGNPEDEEVPAIAGRVLGPRCRITHVDSGAVAELYRLADVMVHPSLGESFGLTIVEALSTGLPVVTHDAPHFRWLADDAGLHVNMEIAGALARFLMMMRGDLENFRKVTQERAGQVAERFGWRRLKDQYVEMYRTVARSTPSGELGSARPVLASRRKAPNAC